MTTTYLLLNVAFFGVLLAILAYVRPSLHKRALAAALGVIVLLTAIFDPLMIAADLFFYDTSKTLGLLWFGAPVEDFAYALLVVPLVAVLWHALEPRRV